MKNIAAGITLGMGLSLTTQAAIIAGYDFDTGDNIPTTSVTKKISM